LLGDALRRRQEELGDAQLGEEEAARTVGLERISWLAGRGDLLWCGCFSAASRPPWHRYGAAVWAVNAPPTFIFLQHASLCL